MDKEFLEAVFNTIKNELVILEPVRDSGNRIIDFLFRIGNCEPDSIFKRSFSQDVSSNLIFERFKNVIETNNRIDEVFEIRENGEKRSVYIRANKFQDGLIVSKEDVTI